MMCMVEYIPEDKLENIKKKSDDKYEEVIRTIILRTIDIAWVEHLRLMEHARSSTGLRSYGQRDPLMEYRREARELFTDFWSIVRKNSIKEADNYISVEKQVGV